MSALVSFLCASDCLSFALHVWCPLDANDKYRRHNSRDLRVVVFRRLQSPSVRETPKQCALSRSTPFRNDFRLPFLGILLFGSCREQKKNAYRVWCVNRGQSNYICQSQRRRQRTQKNYNEGTHCVVALSFLHIALSSAVRHVNECVLCATATAG